MTSTTAPQTESLHRGEDANLDRRYGKIGISAVVAALHYQSETKNPAYAPVRWCYDQWCTDTPA
jgi:hypothetical protein